LIKELVGLFVLIILGFLFYYRLILILQGVIVVERTAVGAHVVGKFIHVGHEVVDSGEVPEAEGTFHNHGSLCSLKCSEADHVD